MIEAWRLKGYELEPWRVAYHEAGHALMAVLIRRGFQYVTIESALGGSFPGHTKTTFTRVNDLDFLRENTNQLWNIPSLLCWKEACLLLAGPCSEIAAMNETEPVHHGDWDIQKARLYINLLARGDQEVAQSVADNITLEIHQALQDNWRTLEEIVSALLDQETMSARQVREIVKSRKYLHPG
jgi:hypothetical protein